MDRVALVEFHVDRGKGDQADSFSVALVAPGGSRSKLSAGTESGQRRVAALVSVMTHSDVRCVEDGEVPDRPCLARLRAQYSDRPTGEQ
jgi:hypothetical protein